MSMQTDQDQAFEAYLHLHCCRYSSYQETQKTCNTEQENIHRNIMFNLKHWKLKSDCLRQQNLIEQSFVHQYLSYIDGNMSNHTMVTGES